MFERLRAAIHAALEAATPPPNLRDLAGQMRQAVVDMRASVAKMRQDVTVTERQLAAERQQYQDAERRGKMAAGIGDQETVGVAEKFARKHAERVSVLEAKLGAQRAELSLADRELAEMTDQLKALDRERPAGTAAGSTSGAWRDLEAAGGVRPETDPADELLRSQVDRAARERTAEEQLKELKKKMGK